MKVFSMVALAAVAVVRAEDAALRSEVTALQAEVAELKALLYGADAESAGLARDRRRLQQDRLRLAIARANKGSNNNRRRRRLAAVREDGSDRVPKMTAIKIFESVLSGLDAVDATNTTVFGYIGDFAERIGKEEDGTAASECIVYTSCSAEDA
jgi:hypothetical protein